LHRFIYAHHVKLAGGDSKVSRVYCLGASAINDVQYGDDDGQPYSNIVENENDLIDVCDLEDIDTRLLALLNQYAST